MLGSQAAQNAQDQQRLMAEGMTAAESCNAIDAALAEGRRVGSAAEERQQALDRAAKERRAQALGTSALEVEPGIKNILVIDGTGISSDFMSEHLLQLEVEPSPTLIKMPLPEMQRRAVEAAWQGMRHERIGLEGGERADRLELCLRAISSGRFHAIILSDLSEESRAIPAVEEQLGPTLVSFIRGGGALAVTSADSAMVLPMLQRLFGATWTSGGYYRTTWAPTPENASAVASCFPPVLATGSFSAKAHAVRSVPEHERMFGTTPESRTQSLVPFMSGRPIGKRTDADSVTGPAEDYDVVVARRTCGAGSLALFCDINMEPVTVQLCLGYCKLASPSAPADAVASLDPAEYARAAEHKARGNAAFSAGELSAASSAYEEALGMYGARGGAAGEQREEKVKICSNLAECFLKLERWEEAAAAASDALALSPAHAKSLVRRAKAADQLGEVEVAARDLRRVRRGGDAKQATAAAALLRPLEAKLREAKKEERRKEAARNSAFAAGFAGALGSGGTPPPEALTPHAARAPDQSRGETMGGQMHGAGIEAAAWARGLSVAKQQEWLVDCYRMRVDDDMYWGGGHLHGLYAKQAGEVSNMTVDFMVFCKLAVAHDVIPVGWDWPAFLRMAHTLLPYAFEKADAKEKWGGENIFAEFTGGRSLRATAEVVYASSCQSQGASAEMRAMARRCQNPGPEWHDVGGRRVWQELARHLGEDEAWWMRAVPAGSDEDASDEGYDGGDDVAEIVASRSAPWRAAAQAKGASDDGPLQPQERVLLCDLVGRPELNGALGTVLLAADPDSGRCCVRVRRPEMGFSAIDDVKLKPQNLRKMPVPTVAPDDARDGFHTLHLAAIEGRMEQAERCLGQGVDPDLLDNDGWTPLMRACLWAQVEVVQLLLVHGATPDVPARETGSTALMFACMHGPNRPPSPHGIYDAFRYKMAVESLLANGAQPAIGNAKGETARMWARQSGATDILEVLSG